MPSHFEVIESLRLRAESAEARLARAEAALRDTLQALLWRGPGDTYPEFTKAAIDNARAALADSAALAEPGGGGA